jgi:hypothetical protein
LSGSERLAALGFIDMDAVRGLAESHLSGRARHADALFTLLTLEEFMADRRPSVQEARA